MLSPDILTVASKICLGKYLNMSLANNRTGELWRSFMPEIGNIPNRLNKEIISAQVYEADYFKAFDPSKTFAKWAAVEVNEKPSDNNDGYSILDIPGGLYAVFHYKGLSTDTSIFQYIFGIYLPASEYELDQRPHFEILGDKYKNNDPESEEDIYIPIRLKTQ
jgi:AraC family transcriptional regulator